MDILYLWIVFVYIDLHIIFVQGQSEGVIRLRRGDSDGSGYIEILHAGTWGRVCNTEWTHTNAHVVCKQLDYNGARFPSNTPAQPANAAATAWLNKLDCRGNEKRLTECTGNEWLPLGSNCQTASVTCTPYLAQHLGCYNDAFERALPNYQNCGQEPRCKCDFTNTGCISDTAMTVELCKEICCTGDTKFAFAGLEAGNQCFCGLSTTDYKKHGELSNADCHIQCVGNPTESCGADYKINVYGCNVGCEIPGRLSTNLVATPPLENKLYDIGDNIVFSCLDGTTLTGEAQITCQAGGGWSGAVPRCQNEVTQPPVVTCAPPVGVPNLLFSPTEVSYTVRESVVFSCATGFELNGSPALTCQPTGQWGGALPTCQQTSGCGPLSDLNPKLDPNAIPSTLATDTGTTVTFTCAEGFVMLAGINPSKLCDLTGWTGSNPVCQEIIPEVTCPKPQVPTKTTYTPDKDTYVSGDVITVKCDLGFKPSGPAELTCSNMGQWSNVLLQCTGIICDPLPTYPNAIPSSMETVFATSVSFRCETGYKMTSEQTPYKTCHTDGWVGPEPVCSGIECGAVPQYPNTKASTTQVTYGTKVSYTCNTGYRTIDRNPVTKTCQTSGDWTPPDPVNCQIIDCGALPPYPDAFPSTSDTVYGTLVKYECHPGFSLAGNIIISKTCTEQGTWTGANPKCEPTVCAPLPPYPFAVPSTPLTDVDTLVMFTCQPGTMIIGNSPTKTCRDDGKWFGEDPTCTDIDDCAINPCQNGAPCVNLINQYVCNCSPGFSGTNCETVGGGVGDGDATSCPAVPMYDHAIPSSTTMTEVAATITYTCEEGYLHNGNPPYKQCLPTGIWDGQTPQCLPVSCGAPEVPTYLSIGTQQTFTFGQTITYMCTDRSLSPSPYSTITCESTKLWSAPPPSECLVIAMTNPPDDKGTGDSTTTPGVGMITVPAGGIDGNNGDNSSGNKSTGGLPVSIWMVILIILIALGMLLLGFILVRRQHEDARRRYGVPKKRRKSRSQLYGSTDNISDQGTLTAVAVTPTIHPRGIPVIKEPGDDDNYSTTTSVSGDSDDELDLRLQTPTSPPANYAYENELEPEYIAEGTQMSRAPSPTSSLASPGGSTAASSAESDDDNEEEEEEGRVGDAVEGDIAAETTQETEETPSPAPKDEADKKDGDKIEDESKFIDNLIDNAKSKVDDCIIA